MCKCYLGDQFPWWWGGQDHIKNDIVTQQLLICDCAGSALCAT